MVGFFSLSFFYCSFYWWAGGRFSCFVDVTKGFVLEQVSRGRAASLGAFGVRVGLSFVLILCLNLSGLFPYVFSNTRHLVITFRFAFVLWLSLLLRRGFFNFGSFLALMLPGGAPAGLNPFLVLVESVSLRVRPITLSVRLAANMGAGHIVLCLVGSYLSVGFFSYSILVVCLLTFISAFYFIFEFGICVIQAYIFFLLLNLYGDEHC